MRRVGVIALVLVTLWAFWPDAGTNPVPEDRIAVGAVNNPVLDGDPLPAGFRQLLPRDAIAPVYEPRFVEGRDARWPRDAQVIGVASGNEAKAYPVSYLNSREMVIDSIAGIPILVTW